MRGHGRGAEYLGYFKDTKGYLELIEDQKTVTDFIKKRFHQLPIFILAHSMGTITTRVLLQQDSSKYEKVVLSGYPNYQKGTRCGILLADILKTLRGTKYKSKLIHSLSVGAFDKQIDHQAGGSWICYNDETVRAFAEDPYCGFGFTCSAFSDLFHLVAMMHKPERYQNVNRDLPLLLLRGQDDPCTGGEKGAKDSYRVLAKAGFRNIQSIAYPHMRHEILNETDHQKVYGDILTFYQAT